MYISITRLDEDLISSDELFLNLTENITNQNYVRVPSGVTKLNVKVTVIETHIDDLLIILIKLRNISMIF